QNCDPCKTTLNPSTNQWESSSCPKANPACIELSSGGGALTGTGVCIDQGGEPVIPAGEPCNVPGKQCKPDAVCIRFSSEPGAEPICGTKCDPTAPNNPQCLGNSCSQLNSGGARNGVCRPLITQRQKLGQVCLGPIGSPNDGDCLASDNGQKLICAREASLGLDRVCLVECELDSSSPDKGTKNNASCIRAGLNNHLCLTASTSEANRGACQEICKITDRLRCVASPCTHGTCNENSIGKEGDCDTPAKEKECASRGGTCVNKTCTVYTCN
ncbi:MAG: hypothetical protein AAGJ35_12500, partial [Myxococcota bacterium]